MVTSFQPTGGDDTAALQAAVACATSLEILAGNGLITAPIVIDHPCEIIWRMGAALWADNPSCDIFSVESQSVRLIEPTINAAQPRTGGSHIRLKPGSHNFRSEGGILSGYHNGLAVEDSTSVLVDGLRCLNGVNGQGEAILINGGLDQKIRNLFANAAPGNVPAAGIRVKRTGDCKVIDSQILTHAIGALAEAGAGDEIASFWIVSTHLDHNASRALFLKAAGGSIVDVRVEGGAASSAGQQGILALTQGDGLIDGVTIDGLRGVDNGLHAIHIEGNTKNVDVIHSSIAGNGGCAFAAGVGVGKFSISHSVMGPWRVFRGNAQWAAYLAGANDNYSITENRWQGNGAGTIFGHAANTPTRIACGNIG